jgi:hypothetical protein
MQAIKEKRNIRLIIIIALIVTVFVCLVAYLIYVMSGSGGQPVVENPTPTPEPSPTGVQVIVTVEEGPTPTPTLVVVETPTPAPTEEPTATPVPEPTSTPTQKSPAELELSPVISIGKIEDLVKNGDFESGFNPDGVALDWHSFNNDSAAINFSTEMAGPYVKSGLRAQRITLSQATQPNRYAGLYQQINLASGRIYTLTLYGQIRTGFADVKLSSYGYRLQYAIDSTGGDKWQDVPEKAWVELPWDEQALNSSAVKFLDYTAPISAASNKITLFVRAWNKWADPGEVQYTLDSISLVGPSLVSKPVTQEALIDQPLPTTGAGDSAGFIGSGRFWGAVLVLLLLATGAIYRAKWNKI